jgi:hypothetical protein
MRLTMKERKEAAAIIAQRYQKARKKDKGMILDEFIALTGYGRRYACGVLRSHGKKIGISQQTVVVGDVRRKARPKSSRVYDDAVAEVLKKVRYIMDCICGKRLAPIRKEVLSCLLRYREIRMALR